jgi:hypothetical protein
VCPLPLPYFHQASFLPEPEQHLEKRKISKVFWSSPRRSG